MSVIKVKAINSGNVECERWYLPQDIVDIEIKNSKLDGVFLLAFSVKPNNGPRQYCTVDQRVLDTFQLTLSDGRSQCNLETEEYLDRQIEKQEKGE